MEIPPGWEKVEESEESKIPPGWEIVEEPKETKQIPPGWEEVKPGDIVQPEPSKLVQIAGKILAPLDYIYGRPARAFESYLWKSAAEGPYQGLKAAIKALQGYPPYTYEQYYKHVLGEEPPLWLKILAETGTLALESLFPAALTERLSILGLQKTFNKLTPALIESERLGLLKPRLPAFDTLDVDKLFNKHYGRLVEAERQAQKSMQAIRSIKKALKLSPEREKLIAWATEQPEKYLEKLTPQERHLVEVLRNHFDKMYKLAEEEGVISDFVENYLTHIYQADPRQVRAILRRLPTTTKFAKERKIPTLETAEELGLKPIYELDKIVGIYDRAVHRAIANKRLMEALSSMTDEYGEPLTRHPEIARRIDELINPYTPQGRYAKTYWWLVDRIKRVIMYNPLVHGWNIYSDVLDEVNFRALKALRMVTKGPKAKELEKLGFKSMDELEKEMAEHGVDLASVWNTASELRRGLSAIESEMKGIRGIARKAESWGDRVLWGKIVAEAQKSIYVLKKAQLMKKGLSAGQAAEAAAHYVNDLLGTLPTHIFGRENARFLRALFFARDWTCSNLRLITGALGLRKGTKIRMPITGQEIKVGELLPQWLVHKGLSPEQMRVLQASYFRHLAKGILGLLVTTNLLNYALTGHLSIQNEDPRHWLDIDTGLKDKQNREIYIVNPLFRYIRDYFGWTTEPYRTMWNKMEPLLKQGIEQIINYSVWQRRPIREPGWPFGLKVQRSLEYFLKGITPLGSLAPRRGEERTWLEALVPLTGTWVRHGMRGGKFAHDLMKYRQKVRAERKLVDEEINELLQQGDFESALKVMLQSERYSTIRGIVNRLLRYKQPLYQRFMSLPNKDKIKFIMTLKPKDRAKFLQLIMQEKEAPFGWEEVSPEEVAE